MLRARSMLGAASAGLRRFATRPLVAPVVRTVGPHVGPVALAFAIAAVYFLLDLRGGDLAAHLYRAELFDRDGFFVWNYNWYGGHYVVSYGLMFPTLAATIGVRLAGAFAYIAAVLLFSLLAREVWDRPGARAAAYVFSAGFSAMLVIGQLPFGLAVAFGLAALLAAQRDRTWLALLLAINCALTSPLAALFISFLAFVVWISTRARPWVAVAAGTLVPAFTVSFLFPEGGSQPFHVASYLGALVMVGFFWFAIRDDLEPKVRQMVGTGVALYVVFLTGNELVASPIGGNAIRLGMILCAPLAAAALWPRAGRFALVAILPLFAWQIGPAAWAIVTHDGTADPRYFESVNAFLDKQDPTRAQKVEIVFTRNHFEAAYIAVHRPIARGWERQLDTKYNAVFYEGELTSAAYARWLVQNDVKWVALPEATPDYSARDEAELIRGGLPYLRLVDTLSDWKIYKVTLAPGGGVEPKFFKRGDEDGFTIQPKGFGTTLTKVRWQRFLRPSAGCIAANDDGWLEVKLPTPFSRPGGPRPGEVSSRPPMVTITADFSISRLVSTGSSCAQGYEIDGDGVVRRVETSAS